MSIMRAACRAGFGRRLPQSRVMGCQQHERRNGRYTGCCAGMTASDLQLKVWADPRSTCSRKVLIALHEKGLQYELVKLDLSAKGQKDPRFIEMHPWGKVPVLQNLSTGLTMIESLAIISYLNVLVPDPPLAPSNADERGLMEQWVSISYSYFKPIQFFIQREMILKARYGWGDPDMEVVAKSRTELEPVLDTMAKRLAEVPYFSGQSFGLADIAFMPEMDMLIKSKCQDLVDSRPSLAAWWQRVSTRPAWQQVTSITVDAGAKPFAE